MGNKYLARIVGNALHKNPFPSDKVPCHRVVKSDRSLGGYASGVKIKKRLLLKEGVKLDAKDKINLHYIIKLKK
jgi:methylated-DNA-[protein]-cysteine S-methyltransferase